MGTRLPCCSTRTRRWLGSTRPFRRRRSASAATAPAPSGGPRGSAPTGRCCSSPTAPTRAATGPAAGSGWTASSSSLDRAAAGASRPAPSARRADRHRRRAHGGTYPTTSPSCWVVSRAMAESTAPGRACAPACAGRSWSPPSSRRRGHRRSARQSPWQPARRPGGARRPPRPGRGSTPSSCWPRSSTRRPAVRGYVLTGDDRFLEPYDGASGRPERTARRPARLLGGGSSCGAELAAGGGGGRPGPRRVRRPDGRRRRPPATRKPAATPSRPWRPAALFDELRSAVDALQARLAPGARDARRALDRATRLLGRGRSCVGRRPAGRDRRRALPADPPPVERPLADLARRCRTVAAGAFDHPVSPSGPAELHELGGALEAMRSRVVDRARRQPCDARAELDGRRRSTSPARTPSSSSSPTSRRTTSRSRCARSPPSASSCSPRYGGQLDERADQYIEFAVDGAKRMQMLINDLLDFSRVGRHTGADPTPSISTPPLSTALANLAALVEESGAEITVGALPVVRGRADAARRAVPEPDRQRRQVPQRRASPRRPHRRPAPRRRRLGS